jgi:tRNA(Ile)-lysidine synthetase-like protein
MGTTVHWSEPEWARSARSPASLVQIEPSPRSDLQGLKPTSSAVVSGMAEAVPFPVRGSPRFLAAQRTLARDDTGFFTLQSRIDHAPWLVANASLSRAWFLSEPVAVQRRLVKAIGDQAGIPLEFQHVEEILHFAAEGGKSGKELSLPFGWKVTRHQDELLFETPDLREPRGSQDYEYSLASPGRTEICEGGFAIEMKRIPADAVAGYNPDELLAADSLPGPLRVRNWRAGDRFWPAHTKSPKKIKELLQERRVAQPERRLWPVVVSRDEIVWMRGFATPARHQPKPGADALLISERRFDAKSPT